MRKYSGKLCAEEVVAKEDLDLVGKLCYALIFEVFFVKMNGFRFDT